MENPIKIDDLGVAFFWKQYDRQYLLFTWSAYMLGYIHIWKPQSYLVNPLSSTRTQI